MLINQCPHQIDLFQWIVDEMPVSVRGFCQYGKWHNIEVEDEVTAFFTYKNGATGVLITTTGEAPGTNRLEISGTKGKLLCEGDKLFWTKNEVDSQEWARTCQTGYQKPPRETIEVETDGQNPQHAGIINNFANYLLGKEELFVPGTDGINGVELMNAIELSGWFNGEEITLPIDEERYLAELNKRRATSKLQEGCDDKVSDNSTETPCVYVTPTTSVPNTLSVGVQRGADLVGDPKLKIAITLVRSGLTSTSISWLAVGKG